MNKAGASWKIAGVYNNTEAIKQAARENLGLAIVPKISVEEEMDRGLVREVQIKDMSFTRKFNLVYHRQKFFTIALQTFMRTCKKNSL